jgi:transposase
MSDRDRDPERRAGGLAIGYTDMRKGFDGLALLAQGTLKRNPHTGQLFVFRGRQMRALI